MKRSVSLALLLLAALPAYAQDDAGGMRDVLTGARPQRSAPTPVHPILTVPFQRGTDIATGWPLTIGNRFELLENGVVAFPRKLALIREAQDTILFTTMIAMDDETGAALGRELVAARARGVKVFAILDGNLTDPRFYLRLRVGGVKVARYNKIFKLGHEKLGDDRTHRLHMKTLVVDSDRAVLGGMNLSDDYNKGDGENSFFHDVDLLVQGPTATHAALHFQRLWGELEPGKQAPEVVTTEPAPITHRTRGVARFIAQESDAGSSAIRDYYLRCFYAANQRIIWHVNNINPKGPLIDALGAAVDRGVEVICITNSIAATGGLYGEKIGGAWYKVLSRNRRLLTDVGVQLYEHPTPVHSKALVVDGVMAAVGSYNLGSAKSDVNVETTFVVYDEDLVGQVRTMLERDLARSTRWDPKAEED